MLLGFLTLRDRNLLFRDHTIDGVIAARQRPLRMQDRGIVDRRPRESSKQCRFFNVQILELLAEVKFSGRRETILAVTHKVQIAVHGQDLLFRVVALDLNRKHRFLDLAPETPFRREEQILA